MLVILLLSMVVRLTFQELNMYYMNNDLIMASSQQSMYDCLHYYVNDDIVEYHIQEHIPVHQIILYCFRPLGKSQHDLLIFLNARDSSFTFYQLRMMNVSSHQLYSWSAPIDLVEQYQIYLNSNNLLSETVFYNCTQPWFGPMCQYSFHFEDVFLSFSDIVKTIFQQKKRYSYENLGPSVIFTNLSCYMHLQCNRGGPYPACLDWREICDRKVDCIDGGFDEKHCDQLEINECNENEYRCHNGQCIPAGFLWDNKLNPECLDGTDEFAVSDYSSSCYLDPAFRCEDRTCGPSSFLYAVECGDGQCGGTKCENKRDVILRKGMIALTSNISDECRDAIVCLTGLDDCKTKLNITEYCPELFQFPEVPVLFGHVKLLYSNVQSEYDSDNIMLPEYVCYETRLCPFSSTVEVSNYSACRHAYELVSLFFTVQLWDVFIAELKMLFHTCSDITDRYCYHHTLYNCNSTANKCISKHRLIDGIKDCYFNDDEEYTKSCSLNNSKHRFPCDDKCLSPILFQNQISDCSKGEDEESSKYTEIDNHIYFQTICDGFTELIPILINEQHHTDETECDMWPCANSYTRCDGYWNCLNGADEVNCSASICPPFQHLCVSPLNNSFICLAIEKAGDGIVDCLGASDERQLCRTQNPDCLSIRFWCRNDTKCIHPFQLCNGLPMCAHSDDEQFCTSGSRWCKNLNGRATKVEQFLCNLTDEGKRQLIPFSLSKSRVYPSNFQSWNVNLNLTSIEKNYIVRKKVVSMRFDKDLMSLGRCNRGLNIHVWLGGNQYNQRCLCPPSYYGDVCQYQNQRISLTLQIRASLDWRTVFAIISTLVDDNEQHINSFDQIEYLPIRDCDTKFNLYLLYSTRPKNDSKNYSIRLDVFNKDSLKYRASWLFPIQIPYLPVYRMAVQIAIPTQPTKICSHDCGINGQCVKYENRESYFCRCNYGWSGSQCHKPFACECSPDSLCISPLICLCPLEKFGPRCYINRNICKFDSCMNGGVCVPLDIRFSEDKRTCICPNGFSGEMCELRSTQINIVFRGLAITSYIFIHFIEVFDQDQGRDKSYIRTTTFGKIGIYQDSIMIYRTIPFHIVFLELNSNYYLTVLQENYTPSTIISTELIPSHRCLSIHELFNITFVSLHLIRRIKYYHVPCQQRSDLACFYDGTQMCLCNSEQHANCFEFDHNKTYDCRGTNHCENDGQCFQDDSDCSATFMCLCSECYYGSRCQLSTKGISLSLDIILGYHILPNIGFKHQPLVTKISSAIAIIIIVVGTVSSLLSILTFQGKNVRDVGCGIYLLASSIISLVTMTTFALKFWFLIFSQMGIIVNRSFLQFSCIWIDFILQISFITGDWFNACVAIERAITVVKGISFDKSKSRQAAKRIIIFIVLFATGTSIQDPIHRHLIDDEEDRRIWCVTKYSSSIQIFNSATILFHSLSPFAINLISAFIIIIVAARKRLKAYKQLSYNQHLGKQFQQHKHLIISSCALVILVLPRLAISFLSGCMKSTRDPWIFLAGYFISFIPPALIFAIFVLPSYLYRTQLKETLKRSR